MDCEIVVTLKYPKHSVLNLTSHAKLEVTMLADGDIRTQNRNGMKIRG